MSLRTDIRDAVKEARFDDLERIVAGNSRTVRYLLGLSYSADSETRKGAARGVGLAARHHPRLLRRVVRRLVWAMNEESGTNAESAPEVIAAIAEERPKLLLPVVPDLVRLSGDESLRAGLQRALRAVAERCPGEVGARLSVDLSQPEKRRKRELAEKARLTRYPR